MPWIAERQLTSQLSRLLDRPVHISQIRFNPYTLSAEASDFAITERDGASLLGFDRLLVNFSLSSLFRWAWSFDEISLETPVVELVRFADGTTNLQRLLPPAAEESDPVDKGLPRLRIATLSISGGEMGFRDETRPEAFITRIAPIDFHAADLTTLAAEAGDQQLALAGESGTQVTATGDLQLAPLRLSGRVKAAGPFLPIAYRYFSHLFTANLSDGDLNLVFDYQLSDGDQGFGVQLDNLSLALKKLMIEERDGGEPLLAFDRLDLQGGAVAWPGKTVSGQSLQLVAPTLKVARRTDGSFNLQHLLAPPGGGKERQEAGSRQADEGTVTASADQSPLADWQVALNELAVTGMAIRFEDHSLDDAPPLMVSDLDFRLRELSSVPGARFPLAGSALLAGEGKLVADGELGLLPDPAISAEVALSSLPLALAQPYLDPIANVLIEGGALNLKARITSTGGDPLAAQGEVEITGLETRGKRQKRPLLGWQSARIDNIEYSAAENALAISSLVFDTPYLRLRINEDQTTNLQRLLVTKAPSPPSPVDNGDALSAGQDSTADRPLALSLGSISVVNGTADFTDRTLPIPFQATMTSLEGETSTLDLTSREPVTLTLEGQVADYGLAQVQGAVLPQDPVENTRLELLFRNVEVPDLSPYTVKFAGYEIASGRMDLDLRYRVEQGLLTGDNNIVLTDLELGDKVPSEGALDLPLGLAIALLKNRDGKIDIDLPVAGDMNKPEFKLGGIIVSAIGNLIRRAVTAPFRLLGSLVGVDSETFDTLVFAPGKAELTPPEREKLAKLAEAMDQRPQLTLQFPGVFEESLDGMAMAEAKVDREIQAGLQPVGRAGDSDRVARDNRRRVVEALFNARFPDQSLNDVAARHEVAEDPARPEGATQLDITAYLATLRRELIAAESVSEDALKELGEARAVAVADTLTASGLAAERIQREPVAATRSNKKGWVPLVLAVEQL